MANSDFNHFDDHYFRFLKQLKKNNNRPWFQENKARYESDVLGPSLEFIRAMRPHLKKISPHFDAIDKRVGGSMMRIYRDTRFAKDKTPYKTNVGIQFRHELGKDVHAPGFYVHLEPIECFLGVGIWHPESDPLRKIRQAIADDPRGWKRTRDNKAFQKHYELAGDSLKKPPRDFDKDHPMITDLKRKDFIAVKRLDEKEVKSGDFVKQVTEAFKASRPFMRFLCDAMAIPF